MFDRKPARHSLVPVGRGLPNIGKQGPLTVRSAVSLDRSGAFDGVSRGCAAIADGPQPCHTDTGVAEVAHEVAMSVGSNHTVSPSPSRRTERTDERDSGGMSIPQLKHPVDYPSHALTQGGDGVNKQRSRKNVPWSRTRGRGAQTLAVVFVTPWDKRSQQLATFR